MYRSQSDSIANLAKAIAAAQLQLKPVKKELVNPFYKSKYADLASVTEALKVYHTQGIAITQFPYIPERQGHIGLTTQLSHESGEWMAADLELPLSKDDAQGVGSALTYGRRYALGCLTGVVTEEDDDGNLAVGMDRKSTTAAVYKSGKERVAKAMQGIREDIKAIVEQDGADRAVNYGKASPPQHAVTQQASDAAPPFNPEVPPPADEQPLELTAANICQQFRLAESIAELSIIMNLWQTESARHPQEERMEVNKVFGEQKKRLAGRR